MLVSRELLTMLLEYICVLHGQEKKREKKRVREKASNEVRNRGDEENKREEGGVKKEGERIIGIGDRALCNS